MKPEISIEFFPPTTAEGADKPAKTTKTAKRTPTEEPS